MAYTYTGTPNQRIEQAKRRISTESVDVNSTLSAYQNRVAEIQQQEQAQAQQQEYESNASGIVRFGDTLGEFFKDVATGLEKAFEGVIDFGAGTVGTIAGWAGNNNLKQEMTDFVSRDLIGEQWDAARNAGLDVDFDDSYINDLSETGQGIVKGVAEGIGQMLPMVVATVATGGAAGAAATAGKISAGTANAIVKAGQVANMVGLGASAAGRGTEEALNTEIVDEYGNVTKPTLDRAYLYGLATGAVEMATEKLVGGIYSKAVGGGIADNLISKLAKSAKFSKAVKFGLDVMGEGVEEMVSASVEKTLQTIYNSTDGKMHWENPDIQDVFVSGVVGTLTSAVMGGGQVAVRKASSVATTQDAMLDIENTLKKANNLSKKGKLAEQAEALESEINKSAELIARRYQRASDKGKERLLAIQGVRELLAEDGSVRKTALNEGVAEIAREKAVGAMSGSLALTRRNEVANVVAAQNTTIAESLDAEQKSNFAKLEKMLALTGKEAGKQMKVVALEKHEANAFIKDDVMYISKDRLADKNATARDFAHEVFHFAEGTKEYRDVAKMFDRMTIDGKNLFDLATDEVKSLGYEVDAKVFEMLKEGKTAEEITNTGISEHDVRLALSEVRARQSEMMFGNAEVITKMAEADQSLAKKILKRIKESIKVIETVFKGDKETLETLKVLRKAEKLWQDALAVSGSKNAVAKQSKRDVAVDSQGRTLSKDQIEYFKDSKVVDENGNLLVVYHGTGETFTQFSRNMIYFSDNADVADSYARDGKEIMTGYLNITKPFVVDAKGSKWSRIPLSANVKRFLDKFEISTFYEDGANRTTPADIAVAIMDAIESGADYDGVIIRNIDDTGRYWKKSPTNLGTDYIAFSSSQFKNLDNKKPTESNDIRYSLRENATDSNGRELTDRQVAYFQDSKVRDKDGNLLVMYHGTDAYKEINVFKKGKSGYLGGGIYLTNDKAYAERYANKNGYKGTIYETYVNAENPLVVTSVDVAREILKAIYGTDTVWKKRTEKQASVTDLITNADINKLRAKGYDGILWDYANSIEISVFESNQIKRVDNENPTYNDDIRYSKRYIYHAGKFNENGHKAETLYTSTPSRHTGFFGTGTYGVDTDHIHELSLGSYKDKPFSVIDISQYNLFDATNDDTAARLHRFLKDITRKAFESKNSEKVNILYNQFKALFPSDKVIAYDEFKSLIDELKQYVKDNEGYTKSKDLDSVSTKFMKHFGYEGVNTIGTYHADTEYGTVIYDLREDSIVVKESTDESQRKAFTDDVRYSKRSFGDTKTKVELLKSLQGMQLDYYGKYYAKIEDPASFFEEGSLGDRLANQILAMADEAEPNKYAFANDLATHIVNNLAVTTVDDYGLKLVLDNANAIREYRHKLNLDGIKGEIQYRYGKKNNIFALWKARKGTTGTYIMDAVNELRYKGVIINAEVDADAFFEMLDMVEFANEQANKVLSGTAKDYLKADEYDALVEGLRDDILSFMENKGTKAEWENYYKTITRQADAYLERAKQKARDIEKLATLEAENALEKAKHAYDKKSKDLQFNYEQKIKEITNEMQQMALNDIEYNQRYNDLVSKVWSEANSLTMDNIKKYKNASDLLNNEFAGVVKKLSGIKWRGELKKAGTRKIIAEFGKWYNTNNPLLTGGLDQAEIDKMMADDNVVSIGYLDKFALRGIEIMRENQTRESMAGKTKGQQIPNDKQLTYDELMICKAVLSSARHILQSYNTLQIAKQRVKLDETATKTNNLATTMSKITHLKHKTTDKILGLMMQALTPADVIGYQFGYQDNALSDLFQQIQDGETHARSLEIDLNDIIDNFFKEHKHYKKTLSSTIKFGEHEIRRDVALSLYMLTLQEDSREGLLLGGWGYTDDTGYWKEQGKMTEGEIRELSQALSNTDKDFVKTLRRFFNAAGEAMAETDMMLKGYSLVDGNANSHYFPIKRYSGDMAKSVADVDAIKNAMSVSVANFSFTHERVKNIRRIDVRPVLSVVKTHAKQVSLYNGLALPIKEFQRLYNFNVADDGSTNSLRNTINEKSWNGFHKYVTKLFEDIQSEKGIKAENGAVSRVLGKVRSNYAKFQLGANMKTWFAQLSGYPAALPYLSPQSMAKAFTKSLYWKSQNAQNLYKYCEWAKVKAHDGGVVLVETLSDKIGVVGDIATKPIQLMDNFLNRILWNAAQFEIERTKGFKFGTKENMEYAGQLHTLLGRKTQGNAATSELAAMQRHTSETVKMLAMFNSDGFKMLSRLFEGITRVRVQNYLAKHNPEMVTAKSQKEAKTFLAKTTTAILTSALIYTLVGELFKFLYDKERKDKEGNEIGFAEDFGMSYLSTVVGMIPIMRDIYSLIVEGYEVDNYALSGITDFITSFEGIAEGVTILASGEPFEAKDLARPLKDLVNALGQLTGIPTRNVYNTIYGLTKRFDASAAYKWDSIFYAQGYTKDLKKAIEKDDVDLQKTIIGLMLKDNGLTDTSEKVNNKLRELYAEGHTVLPKTVQDTLHYDGETYNLSNKQVKQFKSVYGKANEEVEDLVNDRHFASLAADVQAQAIKWIYDYYYESAVFDTIGEEADSKKQLFGETMDVSKFALTIAACKSIESKLDKKGNIIAGSRKIQIQRLLASLNLSPAEKQLILAYLGYSVADQETLIKAFIRRIGLTKAQQKLLLSYCGIAV